VSGAVESTPLSWSTFFGTWTLRPGWLIVCALLVVAYVLGRFAAGRESSVPVWRVASFCAGCALLWVTVASAIGGYAMSVFWMHMVLHLTLIMVVPALLVLGHPFTVLVEACPPESQPRAQKILRSRPVTVLTHPATGFLVYSVTILGTHLTGFMDQMALHTWIMTGEQVLYVVAGYLFLLPLLGEEPIRSHPSYLLRLILLVAAMIPDTVVGIVLLQTSHDPFPVMMGMHPGWAPPALADIQIGGGLMWAAGDGLMMSLCVGLMISVITSPTRRDQLTGSWLEGVRSSTMATRTRGPEEASGLGEPFDPESDEALDAYNRMLTRLRDDR
jgi:cytochrome c oxidase assembly factor CtaG